MLRGISVATDVAQGMMGKKVSESGDLCDQARPGLWSNNLFGSVRFLTE